MFVIVCYCGIYIDKDISILLQLDNSFMKENMPDFNCIDVDASGHCHLLVYTDHQLELLAIAKTWFMDATFRVVNRPWLQLFTINSFIRSGTHMKQVPLMYCFMSSKRKADYYEVNMDVIDKIDKKSLYKTLECFNLFLTMKLILIIVNFRF